jgi:hypothetical protein
MINGKAIEEMKKLFQKIVTINKPHEANYETWLEQVQTLAMKYDWDELTEWYRFEMAFDEGKSPKQAFTECVTMLYA